MSEIAKGRRSGEEKGCLTSEEMRAISVQEQMKNKILYTDEARCDLDSIWDYIALDLQNQQAAERLVNKIMDRVDQLKDFAESGMLLSAISEIIGEERFLYARTI